MPVRRQVTIGTPRKNQRRNRVPHGGRLASLKRTSSRLSRGWGSPGQTYVSLPEETRRAVREDVRRDVGDTGGPIEIEVEFMFASGRK
jgi:hypothetical protein